MSVGGPTSCVIFIQLLENYYLKAAQAGVQNNTVRNETKNIKIQAIHF